MSIEFDPETNYPSLELLLTIYIDMLVGDFGTQWNAVQAFAEKESTDRQAQLAEEIRTILAMYETERELADFFRDVIGTSLRPDLHGYSYRAWLSEALRLVEETEVTGIPASGDAPD